MSEDRRSRNTSARRRRGLPPWLDPARRAPGGRRPRGGPRRRSSAVRGLRRNDGQPPEPPHRGCRSPATESRAQPTGLRASAICCGSWAARSRYAAGCATRRLRSRSSSSRRRRGAAGATDRPAALGQRPSAETMPGTCPLPHTCPLPRRRPPCQADRVDGVITITNWTLIAL